MASLKKFRTPIQQNFTMVPNDVARGDTGLSDRARAVLIEMMSHMDGFDLSHNRLLQDGRGDHALRSALKELEEAGNLIRTRERNEDGTLGKSVWVHDWYPIPEDVRREVAESGFYCQSRPTFDNPTLGYQTLDNPTPKNTTTKENQLTNNHARAPGRDPVATPRECEPPSTGETPLPVNNKSGDRAGAGDRTGSCKPHPLPPPRETVAEYEEGDSLMQRVMVRYQEVGLDLGMMVSALVPRVVQTLGGEKEAWEYFDRRAPELAAAGVTSRTVYNWLIDDSKQWKERTADTKTKTSKSNGRGYTPKKTSYDHDVDNALREAQRAHQRKMEVK